LVKLSFPKDNPVFQITDSGSRGSWEPINQMTGIKGLVQGPQNRIIELPITSSYGEGFDVLEYFTATHGARKGVTDTALKTAQAGYLTRRLVDQMIYLLSSLTPDFNNPSSLFFSSK